MMNIRITARYFNIDAHRDNPEYATLLEAWRDGYAGRCGEWVHQLDDPCLADTAYTAYENGQWERAVDACAP